jgi:hypothetical protein
MKVLVIYSQADAALANLLCPGLESHSDIDATRHPLGAASGPKDSLAELLKTHDAVVQLVSERFLTSLDCMRELVPIIKDDGLRSVYREYTVPVLMDEPSNGLDIADTDGQLQIVDTWIEDANKLEEVLLSRSHVGTPLNELREELAATREVAEQVLRFMRTITNHIHTCYFTGHSEGQLDTIMSYLQQVTQGQGNGRAVTPYFNGSSTDRETLSRLHDGIVVASEDDPNRPEFPPFSPCFPATPTVRLEVRQLNRSILIKDESRNLTGSHKDRMAWEIVVHYKKILNDLLEPSSSRPAVPTASIISNGSAAFAIQVMMRCYGLPDLKVLVDQNTDKNIVAKLRRAGCHVFIHDLSERLLHSTDVLEITENVGGLDFTSRDLVDPNRRTYYDWLAYEILNRGAKHIFIPVGTGDLFVNVLTLLRDELTGVKKDRRLEGGARTIEGVQLYGATSEDWKTKMDKLWAAYRPTLDEARRVCAKVVEDGHCGPRSKIYDVDERFVRGALDTAHAGKIQCDESGIAGLALLLQLSQEEEIPEDEEILVVNTGWLALP